MERIMLLDSTLRDGGFVNDWNFGEENIVDIICRLELANIDVIEVGYIRDKIAYNPNRTQFSCVGDIDKTINKGENSNSLLVATVDYGECSIAAFKPCDKSCLDGVRVTFKKKNIDEGIAFCKEIKKLGYKVFVQPVSAMDYAEEDVIDLVKRVNEFSPFSVSIVDTYGVMNQKILSDRVLLMDKMLNVDIYLGYHSHNNLQLAYSNAISMINLQTRRPLIIDASILGMGKGAGNANTELVALYLNEFGVKKYDIDGLAEIASLYIEKELKTHKWGYNLKYFIAAEKKCHPQYVDFLISNKTLSIYEVNTILSRIPTENAFTYDSGLISDIYTKYQSEHIDN